MSSHYEAPIREPLSTLGHKSYTTILLRILLAPIEGKQINLGI